MQEIIKEGKTGFMVKNRSEMKKAIKRISEIDRRVCREDVERRFSPASAALKYARLYQQEIQLYSELIREDIITPTIGPEDIFISRAHTATYSMQLRKKNLLSPVSD